MDDDDEVYCEAEMCMGIGTLLLDGHEITQKRGPATLAHHHRRLLGFTYRNRSK